MSFEPGSLPSDDTIPLSIPEISGNEWKYIKECLDTNWVSSVGPFVTRFEEMVASFVHAQYGVACTTGTAALHVALLVAGVQPNDEVVVSDLTFIAPANAIRYIGAWPVFIDADPEYWQMDVNLLRNFLENDCVWGNGTLYNKTTGRRVKAIVPVHILGHPCDMDPIMELARRYSLVVIEDATESLGAYYKGRKVGSLGDIACFSFNGNKIITTGGGGMLVTNNIDWAKKARYLTTQAKDDPLEYIHNEIGYNYRLTNLQAAMGCAQMEQLDNFIQKKKGIAETYKTKLEKIPGITVMKEASWATSIFWLYTILVDDRSFGMNSRALLVNMRNQKIQTRPLWQPLHLSPIFTGIDTSLRPFIVSERLNAHALSLPSSVGLQDYDLMKVIETIILASKGN